MTLTFKQKMMLLPGVAAVFLLAILGVTLTAGIWAGRAQTRIGQGYSPALARSQTLMADLQTLHHEVQDAVHVRDEARLEPMRALGRKIAADLEVARRNAVANPQLLEVLQKDFVLYQEELESAVVLHARQDAQATAALTRESTRFESLLQTLQLLVGEHQRGLRESFQEVSSVSRWGQVLVGLLVVLCMGSLGGLSYWMMREVAGPLTRLSETASRLAEGDLTLTIEVHANDELGHLARSLGAMVLKLRAVPVELQGVVGELSAAAERLTRVSQEQLNFLTEQARSLSDAGTTMAQIAQTSSMASSRAEMVLKVAEQADSFTAASQQSIEQSAQGLEQIRKRVGALVGNIGHLSEQAVHAREIIGSVKDLADQSNVLALNAAIEAARAGEGGRGFAVVAREMRTLSGQSLQSTERIGRILLDINDAIRQTVSTAEGDSQQMEASIEQVLASADKLREITSVMQESSNAARQIVASVTQQNAGITQMTEVMTQLSAMMGDVVLATTSAEETVGRINDTVSQLRRIVSEFRV
ncbi:methyl-accepting chemotaxis protein [Hyalangium rubrum]|uniref:Methyl-accepting chemotaxis protein n=1 Tax=Hyalangium rubrum TaxID=3103134 RepID=A0ABU5GYY2_9BACT|nr:methyl-accepting chemotaxis protein [Hyalangium sp. s54d21]MDY7226412.1 methyl-accepting chemotaxis protein [Hyalangium sp. s54d21]